MREYCISNRHKATSFDDLLERLGITQKDIVTKFDWRPDDIVRRFNEWQPVIQEDDHFKTLALYNPGEHYTYCALRWKKF